MYRKEPGYHSQLWTGRPEAQQYSSQYSSQSSSSCSCKLQTVVIQSLGDWINFAFITLKDLIAGKQHYITVADIFLPRIKTGGKKCEQDPPFHML